MKKLHNDISSYRITQYMTNKDFEIYHYRDPYFNAPDFHNHDFYEVYIFLDGNVTYYIEDKIYDLTAGDIILIPPGKMHRPYITDNKTIYERIVLWINSDYLVSLDDKEQRLFNIFNNAGSEIEYLISLPTEDFNFINEIIKKLIQQTNKLKQSLPILKKSYITIILYMISLEFKNSSENISQTEVDIIPDIIKYINEHLKENLTLEDICNEFFISKFHLIRKFKEHTNSTVYDYIISKRIIIAKKLIRQGFTAINACQECGFSDYSNFYRAFVNKTGMTPSNFKSQSSIS